MINRLFRPLLAFLLTSAAAAQSLSPATLPNGTAGVFYSQTISVSGIPAPVSCQIASGVWPIYMSLSSGYSSCTINGSPSGAGSFSFTLLARDSSWSTTAYQNYTLSFVAPVTITTASLPGGVEAIGYSATLSASGGSPPYSWSISSGSLPPGLSLSAGGLLSGTPGHSGTYAFQVKVSDSGGATATQNFGITVGSNLAIATSSLPGGIAGAAYSATLLPSNGDSPYSWSVLSGTFPSGLTLSTAGSISGTPTTPGTYDFTVKVTDGGTGVATKGLSIRIGAAVGISTISLPSGLAGSWYSSTVAATGGSGSYTGWALSAGALPLGVNAGDASANPLTLSGTPTAAGTYNFTWRNCDAVTSQCAWQTFSVQITAALSIATASLPNAAYGAGYSQALSASGGTPPYTWSLGSGSLPAGVSLSSTGTISGTTTGTGDYAATFKVIDSTSPTPQTVNKTLALHVNALASIGIDGAAVFWGGGGAQPAGTTTTYYSSTPQVFGGEYTFTGYAAGPDAAVSSLQVRLDGNLIATPTSGATSRNDGCSLLGGPAWPGCPNVGFVYSFPASTYSQGSHTLSFRATDANGLVGAVTFPITIISSISITTTLAPNGLVGSAYSASLAASGGTEPYTWTIRSGSLPPGLSLSGASISGAPTVAGTYNFSVQAMDSSSPTKQVVIQAFSIYVNSPVSITTGFLSAGLVSTAYSQTLTASGGTPGYTWSVTDGTLPAGLTLNSSGNIFGTPTAAGASTFTVQVTDTTTPTAQTASKTLSITTGPAVAITTGSLATGLATTSYNQTLAASGGTPPYRWSLASGSLPAGLSLSEEGVISGTPTTAGTAAFAVKATDSTSPAPQTATQSLTLTVTPSFNILTTTLPNAVAGGSYSQALVGNGGTAPYIWALSSGSLPPGLTLSGGAITGTPSSAGAYNFVIRGADSTSPITQAATQALSITVGAALKIATASLSDGLAASAYSQALAATGGNSPYAWSLLTGSLPPGLSLSTNGSVYGVPASAGTYPFTVQVADSTSPTPHTLAASLSITIEPALAITATSLATGMVATAYSQTLAATGGASAYSWSLASGGLPAGVTLSSAGILSGTPTEAGLFSFVAQVTDGAAPGAQTATRAFTLNILATLTISTSSLPDGLETTSYSQTLAATGGTPSYGWSLAAGSLPPGLTISPVGLISGTPTTAGNYNFTARTTDSTTPTPLTATELLSITIRPALAITTTSAPDGIAGSPYAQLVSATGGNAPYTWTVSSGSLPPGLTLTQGGGLSGAPTASGSFTFTIKATDSTSVTPQIATQSLTIAIADGLTVTTTTLAPALATTTYSQSLTATGGTPPYIWSLASGALPAGLSLSSAGAISGTPTAAGVFAFVVKAVDATTPMAQSATQALSIMVAPALSITTSSLAAGMVGQFYSQTVAATGGTPGYSWSVSSGSLPTGLALSGDTISGTPTAAGTMTFTLKATDSTSPAPQTASASFSVAIGAAFQITASSPLPSGLGGNPYNVTLEALGGTPPYMFTLASGAPPAGLTLRPDGALSGVPTTSGSFLFSVLATDSTTPTAQTQIKPLAITITPPLAIETRSLPRGLVGSSYAQGIVATGGTPPYAWSISSGALPQGVSLSADGSLLGAPTEAGAFTFAAKVTDNSPVPQTAIQALSIAVGEQLTITTSSLPAAVFGAMYNVPLAATGGTAPYKWAVVSGTLPPGLSLSLAGYIVGTCTGSGVFTVTVQATDTTTPAPQTATRVLTLDSNTSLSITTGSLPASQSGQSYRTSLNAAGGVPPYIWAMAAGALPAGLSLAIDGAISGTPTGSGTSTVSFRVTDSSGNTTSRSFSLTVLSPLSVTTTTLPPATMGSSYGTSLSASGGTTPYTWTVIGGNLPAGLTLSTSGLISGIAITAGAESITVQVTDNSQPAPQTAAKTFAITVTSPLSVASTLLPNGVNEVAYSQSLVAAGGASPYAWALTSGALPAGITLDTAGVLSGTPINTGTSLFTLQVTDSATPKQSAARSFSLLVAAPISITATSLPQAIIGRSYTFSLSATGGQAPYAWSTIGGSLPHGLQLSAEGAISGVPTTTGTVAFTVQVTDSGGQTANRDFTITAASDFSITVPSLSTLYVGQPISVAATATGGSAPYTWTVVAGQMPGGTVLQSDGRLVGAPTTAGSFTFTIQASDSSAPTPLTVDEILTVTVLSPLVITTPALPPGTTGVLYSETLSATGGDVPYIWSVLSGSLPPGLTLTGGSISGAPSASGAYTVTVGVADGGAPRQSASQQYTITVVTPLSVVTTTLPAGLVSAPYHQVLAATGGVAPYTWTILTGSLPAGLSLDPAGLITGTPSGAAASAISVQVVDSATQGQQTATRAFSLNIGTQLAIATTSLAAGLQAAPYSQTLAAGGGSAPYAWSIAGGQLPAGLVLNAAGAISGVPTAAGTFTFTIQALDGSDPVQTATKALSITINPPLSIVTTSLPNPADGVTYSQILAALGGTPPYTWAISTGALPPGLLLNPDGGIMGIPSGSGSYSFTVQVTDATQPTAQIAIARFTLQTTVTFQITTSIIPPGIIGVPYSVALTAVDGTTPYTWTVVDGELPPGLNLTPAGTIAGAPEAAGAFTFTIRATDSAAPNRSSSVTFTVQIQPALAITTTTLPDTTVATPYSAVFTATGGNTPYTWMITSGTLPNGLTLKPDGILSGIALAPANSTFTVQVTDTTHPTPQTASRSFTVDVMLGVSIATSTLPDAYVKIPYAAHFEALGGLAPYTWSATGLPEGVTLTSGGYLEGTPTTAGTFTVNAIVRDTYTPPHTASKTFALNVRSGVVITTTSLPDGQVGAQYSQSFSALFGTAPYVWSIDAGSLPVGLVLTTDGILSGTPAVAGGYTFTLRVADSTVPTLTTTQTLSLRIQAGLSITTTSLPSGVPDTVYSATLQATGGNTPYTWSVASGALPPGLNLMANGSIVGMPTTGGAYSFTVQVADATTPRLKATRLFSIAIGASLTIGTATLADARLGAFYRQMLTALNGKPPYYWTLQAAGLPPGFILLANGDIVGQPTAVGAYAFTVTVQDSAQPPATASQTFTINVAPGFAIAPQALPNGTPGAPYQTTLNARDGVTPYIWSIALGELPPGVRLNATSGTIAGVPTTPGIYNLLIQATDSSDRPQTTAAQFTLTIDSTLQITTATLPEAVTGSLFFHALSASNGVAPFQWSLSSALPPGLSLLPTGELYGVPTTPGYYKITVAVSDSSQPTARACRDVILLVSQTLMIVTDSVPGGAISKPYAAVISATGGRPPYRFTASNPLPPGLALSVIGAVTGAPIAAGVYTVTVQATDAEQKTQSRQLVFVIGSALTITTTSLPSGSTDKPYFAALKATGGAGVYIWSAVANPLPPGVSFLPSIGAFVGAPTTPGQYTVQLSLTDGQGATSTTLTITIAEPLTVPAAPLPPAQKALPYSAMLAARGGVPPYTWGLGSGATLPAGLTLSPRGVLAGEATVSPDAYPLSFCVTDSAKPSPARFCAIRTLVVGPAFHMNAMPIEPAVRGRAISLQFTTSGGQGSVTFAAAFPMPSGLSLTSDGLLSGTPVTAGGYTLTLIASDTAGQLAVADFSLIVVAPLTITTTVLPPATLGTRYAAGILATSGTPPYRWSADTDTLPSGFVLDGSGTLYGSPSAVRSDDISVTVTDSSSPPQVTTATVILSTDPPITSNGGALPNAAAGNSYTTTLSATGAAPLRWAIVSGQLPSGMTLSPDGAISGMPLAAGYFAFVASVVDSHGQTAAAAFSLLVTPGLTLGSETVLPNGTVGEGYTYTFNAAFSGNVKWSLVLGVLPTGLTLAADGTLAGKPVEPGSTSFLVQASAVDQTARQVCTVTVDPPTIPPTSMPTIPGASTHLPTADLGQPYATSLTANSGTQPYAWAITNALLPAGLTLSPEGVIAGTPREAGSFVFALTVADQNSQTASALFTLTVRGPLTIVTQAPITTYVNSSINAQLIVTGGAPPYTWSATASLPDGMTLSPSGLLSGKTTTTGSFTIRLSVRDASSTTQPATATLELRMEVFAGVAITTSLLAAAMRDAPYSVTLAAAGGVAPYVWNLSDDNLAPGLRLSPDGAITGIPSAIGAYRFVAMVSDANLQTATATLSITVTDPLRITTAPEIAVTLGKPLSLALTATGGTQPYSWSVSVGALPAGLTLSPTGMIFGTLSNAVTATLTISVRDAGATPATASQEVLIAATGALAITTTSLPPAYLSAPYTSTLRVSGGASPYSWSTAAGALPPGLNLSVDGILTGIPISSGNYVFTVTVVDSGGQRATATLTCTVAGLAITTSVLPDGTAGAPYTAMLDARGGLPPYTWSSPSPMPKGLLFTADGVITGTPTASFGGSLMFTVTDQANRKASATLELSISGPATPTLQIGGVPHELPPTTQTLVSVSLAQPSPLDMTGELTIQFAPDVPGRDDSALTFVPSNARVAPFTITKGSTTPRFQTTPLLQAGTSAGAITLAATLSESRGGAATMTSRIAPAAPVITDARILSRDTYSVTLELRGYSTTGEVSTAHFAFEGLPTTSTVSVDVKALFTAWYASQSAANQGGLFQYKQMFNFTGATSELSSISVTLTNSVGTTRATVVVP